MSRQYTDPYVIRDGQVQKLEHVAWQFDENWLQNFVFTHSASIPIGRIEPAFGDLIPVCRELPTKVGPIDLLFVNCTGLLTLVECKLWKNPEARREVVGQILDYAKEISQWSYETLQNAINDGQGAAKSSLYELVSLSSDEIDESDFIDNVSRNLRRGRFLLLIIGDGIRENVEQIIEFLQENAHLNFSFALVEFAVSKLKDQDDEFFVQPLLLAQTVEIERAVFRIEDDRIIAVAPATNKVTPSSPKRTKISEQVFFEDLETDDATKASLRVFLEKVQELGVSGEPGQNSINLKSQLYGVNFGIFSTDGTFYNRTIASVTQEMGYPQIGEEYLSQFAELFDGGNVRSTNEKRWTWTVQIKKGNEIRKLSVAEVMAVQDQWIEIIQKTLDSLSEATGM